ncbi:MAG: hypothetical protein R2847_13225 [Bacteroidia bacterium]
MTIQIPAELVEFYLSEFTVHWFEDNEDAPDDLNDYNDLIDGIRRHLRDENDTDAFKAALEYLIQATDDEVTRFDGGSGFGADELRTLMRHVYQRFWGNLPAHAEHVEFI